MSYIFKPRRGKSTTMSSSSTVLAAGEMFLEYPSGGVGKGDSNIKVGDGSTAYSSLPYTIGTLAPVTFTATSLSNTTANNTTLLGRIVSGASSATMFAAIKNLLTNLNSSIEELTNDNASSVIKLDLSSATVIRTSFKDSNSDSITTNITNSIWSNSTYYSNYYKTLSAYTYTIPISVITAYDDARIYCAIHRDDYGSTTSATLLRYNVDYGKNKSTLSTTLGDYTYITWLCIP